MRSDEPKRRSQRRVPLACLALLALVTFANAGNAALPREVERAFRDAKIPLSSVGIVVQEVNGRRPLCAQQIDRPFNPASVMKLVTTLAALELLGPDYRWKTDAYLNGTLERGVLHGDLLLKGGGDPKI